MKLLILLCLFTSVLGCGIRISKPHSRQARAIIGGKKVHNPKRWPWQVLLLTELGEDSYVKCGGTVIGKHWILTAAHCVTNSTSSDISVYDGLTHIEDREYWREVIETVIHPYYEDDSKTNDIALLKLAEPILFDNLVSPICLPNASQSIPEDSQAVITGFGNAEVKVNGTSAMIDGQLREAIVPIVNLEDCVKRWVALINSTVKNVEQEEGGDNDDDAEDERKMHKIICASSYAHGTHLGDSGGPLMMQARSGRWFQLGVTSFIACVSENCDAPDEIRGDLVPKTFTDVRAYCDWITENTEGEVNCYKREVILEDVEIKA